MPNKDKNDKSYEYFFERMNTLLSHKNSMPQNGNPPTMDRCSALSAIDFFSRHILPNKSITSLPYVYPSFEGGVIFEWEKNDWIVSIEFLPTSNKIEFHALCFVSQNEVLMDDLNNKESILKFNNFWQRLAKSGPRNRLSKNSKPSNS